MKTRPPRLSDNLRHPVTARQVHPEAWQTALRLAGGDISRIDVQSDTVVLVR